MEIYRKGRSQVRLGIVDSISITRGTGNAAWSVDQLPLGVDVNFSITDLTQIMHLPIDDSLGAYDDDNTYTDYIATLGSLGLADMTMLPEVMARAKAKFQYDWYNLIFDSQATMSTLLANANLPIPGINFTIKNLITEFSTMTGGKPLESRETQGVIE